MGKNLNCPQCDQSYNGKLCGICGFIVKDEPKPAKKEKAPKKPKEERTEAQIVASYAKKIMEKAKSRNMMPKTHKDMVEFTPSKDIWQDKEFYFSVVFQSKKQKIDFLSQLSEKYDIRTSEELFGTPKILNGLKLAEAMGFKLNPERTEDFPIANMDLKDIILDNGSDG